MPTVANSDHVRPTLLWSAKEAVFKWYGDGSVDFKGHIHLLGMHESQNTIDTNFSKTNSSLQIHYRVFEHLVLTWTVASI
jgi:phosphopantetheinyl transferase